MQYNYGIYAYFDNQTQKIAYVGKDSRIHKSKRRIAHRAPSQIKQQPFNRALQGNLERYNYFEIARNISNEKELNFLEKCFIKYFNPKFNFTEGGDGVCGYHHTEETRRKLSENHKGHIPSDETRRRLSENNARYWLGKKKSLETRKRISEGKKGTKHSEETRRKMSENNARYWFGKKLYPDAVKKIAKAKSKYTLWNTSKANFNKTAFFRNNKNGDRPLKCFYTRYNGKHLPIGCNLEFITCEIINDLIREECG